MRSALLNALDEPDMWVMGAHISTKEALFRRGFVNKERIGDMHLFSLNNIGYNMAMYLKSVSN